MTHTLRENLLYICGAAHKCKRATGARAYRHKHTHTSTLLRSNSAEYEETTAKQTGRAIERMRSAQSPKLLTDTRIHASDLTYTEKHHKHASINIATHAYAYIHTEMDSGMHSGT